MKNNTYDATGLKFGVLVFTDSFYESKINNILVNKESLHKFASDFDSDALSNSAIVPFEQVDGLSFADTLGIPFFNKKKLLFTVYNEAHAKNNKRDYKFQNILLIDVISIDEIGDLSIKVDDYLCSYFQCYYKDRNANNQDYIKCFLERYKYGSKEEVDKVLIKIND